MRGWETTTTEDMRRLLGRTAKPSKYRNVKCVVDGHTFASKKEGAYYLGLKARAAAGEITDLQCQVPFTLCCPTLAGVDAVVAAYVADFTYREATSGRIVVVDVKGHKTPGYLLKKRWLFLQDDIEITEV